MQWLSNTVKNTNTYLTLPLTYSEFYAVVRQRLTYSSSGADSPASASVYATKYSLSQIRYCQADTVENCFICVGY